MSVVIIFLYTLFFFLFEKSEKIKRSITYGCASALLVTLYLFLVNDYGFFVNLLKNIDLSISETRVLIFGFMVTIYCFFSDRLLSFLDIYKKVFIVVIFLASCVEGLGNIYLFYPCLLYFLINKKVSFSVYLISLVSWLTFLVVKNESLANVIFILQVISFNYFFMLLYESKNFFVLSYPSLLLHFKSINLDAHYSWGLIILICSLLFYFWCVKFFENKKSNLVILLIPLFVYVGSQFWSAQNQIESIMLFLYLLCSLLKVLENKEKKHAMYFGVPFLLLYLFLPFSPLFKFGSAFNEMGLSFIFYLILIMVNFVIGSLSVKYIKTLILDKKKIYLSIKNEYGVRLTALFIIGIMCTLYLKDYDSGSIVLRENEPVVYILAIMSLALGIMFKYIADDSNTIKDIFGRMYYKAKSSFSFSFNKKIPMFRFGDGINLNEISYLFKNHSIQHRLELIIVYMFIVLVIVYLMVFK